MNNVIKFGEWFTWESHDDYVDEAMERGNARTLG